MENWNVIATILPGPGHMRRVLDALNQWGEFHPAAFKDVCLGRADDVAALLEGIRQAREAGRAWCGGLARVIPLERTFRFTPGSLVEQLKEAVAPFAEGMSGGTFCVRLERRGLAGQVMSQEVEREVAEYLFGLMEARGKSPRASFADPDDIVAAETLGDECGVALLTREMRDLYPFIQTR